MAASCEGWGGRKITTAELIGKLLCALLSFISAVCLPLPSLLSDPSLLLQRAHPLLRERGAMFTINNTQSKKGTSRKPGPSGAGPQSPWTPAGGAEPPRWPRSPTCLSPLAEHAGRLPQLTTSSPEAAASRGQVSDQYTLRANSTTQACPSKAPSALALSSFSPTTRFSAQGPRKMHVFMNTGMA